MLLILPALLLTGCVSTQIQSNKAADFSEKVDKLLLVVQTPTATKNYLLNFTASLKQQLTAQGVASQSYYVSDVALDPEKELAGAVTKYGPDALLIVSPRGGTISQRQFGQKSVSQLTLDRQLVLPGADSPVWRASTEIGSGMYQGSDISLGIDKTVKAVVAKMRADGLLPEGSGISGN